MVATRHVARVDTLELKDAIYRKIGDERAQMYFGQLNKFLSLKLSKAEFDKSCIELFGRDDIDLHNSLIRSILQNASHANKVPPPKIDGVLVKDGKIVKNGHRKNGLLSPLGPIGKSFTCEEDVDAGSPGVHSWKPLTAPLGVAVKSSKEPLGRNSFDGFCKNGGELPDSLSLWTGLGKKLSPDGFGISKDCADLLNKSLDVFLKRLIKPCIDIAGSRSEDSRALGQLRSGPNVSMVDFRVAMESNPRMLGEDGPTQLEKMYDYTVDE